MLHAWRPRHSAAAMVAPSPDMSTEDFSEEAVAAQLASAREAGAEITVVFIHWQVVYPLSVPSFVVLGTVLYTLFFLIWSTAAVPLPPQFYGCTPLVAVRCLLHMALQGPQLALAPVSRHPPPRPCLH